MFYYRVDNDLHVKGLLPDNPLNGGHADPQVVCVEHIELLHVHELIHVVLGHLEGGVVVIWIQIEEMELPEQLPRDEVDLHIVSAFHLSHRLLFCPSPRYYHKYCEVLKVCHP